MNIIFSILHYKAAEVTINCIDSILNLNYSGNTVQIIVVDNGSGDNSGYILRKKYGDRIKIIESIKNEGFARGNNIGYIYAKNKLQADCVIVLNNDTVINQKNFIFELVNLLEQNKRFSIIAPDIINRRGAHQNPIRNKKMSIGQILYIYMYNVFMYVIMHFPLVNRVVISMLNTVHNYKKPGVFENNNYESIDIVPHGAAIIFTGDFLKKEDLAFNPNTFLYAEEELLYEYAINNNYGILYSNKLKISHLEDVSTNAITKNEIAKRKFVSKNKIKSTSILLKMRIHGER